MRLLRAKHRVPLATMIITRRCLANREFLRRLPLLRRRLCAPHLPRVAGDFRIVRQAADRAAGIAAGATDLVAAEGVTARVAAEEVAAAVDGAATADSGGNFPLRNMHRHMRHRIPRWNKPGRKDIFRLFCLGSRWPNSGKNLRARNLPGSATMLIRIKLQKRRRMA